MNHIRMCIYTYRYTIIKKYINKSTNVSQCTGLMLVLIQYIQATNCAFYIPILQAIIILCFTLVTLYSVPYFSAMISLLALDVPTYSCI